MAEGRRRWRASWVWSNYSKVILWSRAIWCLERHSLCDPAWVCLIWPLNAELSSWWYVQYHQNRHTRLLLSARIRKEAPLYLVWNKCFYHSLDHSFRNCKISGYFLLESVLTSARNTRQPVWCYSLHGCYLRLIQTRYLEALHVLAIRWR